MKESSDECKYESVPGNTWSLEAAVSREGRHGVPHHRRVSHLHDFRCGLSFLFGEEPHGTVSARSAGNAHLLHDLFVVQQSHDSLCGKISGTWLARRIP